MRAEPLQHLGGGLRALALGVTADDHRVDHRHRALRPGRHRHDAPLELGAVGHVLEVVHARLEQRDLALQELVAGEVAVVVGVGRRRRHLVLVDQVDDVLKRLHRLGPGEHELAVGVLELAAVAADEVVVDALQVLCGRVAPLLRLGAVEATLVAALAVGVDGEFPQHRQQGVSTAAARRPDQAADLLGSDAGVVQQLLVVVHGDAAVGELRHPPQLAAQGVLLDGGRHPIGLQRIEVAADLDHRTRGVGLKVRAVHHEDVVGAAAAHVGAQLGEVVGPRHQRRLHGDAGVGLPELGERGVVSLLHLLVPQPHGDGGAGCRTRGGRGRLGLLLGGRAAGRADQGGTSQAGHESAPAEGVGRCHGGSPSRSWARSNDHINAGLCGSFEAGE